MSNGVDGIDTKETRAEEEEMRQEAKALFTICAFRLAVQSMARGKATGLDGVSVELLAALPDTVVGKIIVLFMDRFCGCAQAPPGVGKPRQARLQQGAR